MHKPDIPEEHNYETTDTCDSCKKKALGTMLHANSASGMATPVLFLCDRCHKPNWIQARYDDVTCFFLRQWLKAKRLATTTRAEREAHRIKMTARRAELAARRAEREARLEKIS